MENKNNYNIYKNNNIDCNNKLLDERIANYLEFKEDNIILEKGGDCNNRIQCQHCKRKIEIGLGFLKHIEESNVDGKSYRPKSETCKKFGVSMCFTCKQYILLSDTNHQCSITKEQRLLYLIVINYYLLSIELSL